MLSDWRRVILLRAFILIAFALSACDTGPVTDADATTKSPKGTTLSIKIVNATTLERTNSISNSDHGKVIAILKTSTGAPVSSVIVTFATTYAVMSPEAGTSLTDSSGNAAIEISPSTQTGAGEITASVDYGGESISVSTGFTISNQITTTPQPVATSAELGSIEFVAATPDFIVLQGTGGTGRSETSVVTFQVKGTDGSPMVAQDVDFMLNTEIGGLSLASATAKTNADGKVSTVVRAGTIPSSVRVTATVSGTSSTGATISINTQSDMLTLSTGIADQNSFSLSLSKFNPEAWDYDGEEVDITARLADHYNNVVPDGTTVYFTTEGGAIQPSCQTQDGACSVKWRSQNPRPKNHRVTILATAVGNESFVDKDSNGQYTNTDGEPYADSNDNNIADEPFNDANINGVFDEPFTDVANERYDYGEPFIDAGNGSYDVGEFYVDSNHDGNYDAGEPFVDRGNGVRDTGESYTDINGNAAFDAGEVFTDQKNGVYDYGEMFTDIGNGKFDTGESFTDTNVNGIYDSGEAYVDVGNGVWDSTEPFVDALNAKYDEGEAFVDVPNNKYDLGEDFVDYNRNGVYDGAGTNPAGETSYTDRNGNGAYDGSGRAKVGESFTDVNGNSAFDGPGFADLGEPYLDSDEDGSKGANELYFDTDNDATYDETGDEKYNGILCVSGQNCSSLRTLHVRRSAVLVMSSSAPRYTVYRDPGNTNHVLRSNVLPTNGDTTINFTGRTVNFSIVATDTADQPLPAGTTISFASTVGKISGPTSYGVLNTNSPLGMEFATAITDENLTEAKSGTVTITIKTPKGNEYSISFSVTG